MWSVMKTMFSIKNIYMFFLSCNIYLIFVTYRLKPETTLKKSGIFALNVELSACWHYIKGRTYQMLNILKFKFLIEWD